MKIETHDIGGIQVAEVVSEEILLSSAQDGLDILGDVYYRGFDRVVLHEKNITPGFFDLKSGLAGEVLQKFANYRVRLAIVGEFSKFTSKSFKDFVFESNQGRHICFAASRQQALDALLK